jgi:hypothetical protein
VLTVDTELQKPDRPLRFQNRQLSHFHESIEAMLYLKIDI